MQETTMSCDSSHVTIKTIHFKDYSCSEIYLQKKSLINVTGNNPAGDASSKYSMSFQMTFLHTTVDISFQSERKREWCTTHHLIMQDGQ